MLKQTGSALVEFVVVAVVLTPIMFGIPMIGKMIDLKQTTVQASRYGAWETTVTATPKAPTQNLDQRFFSDASLPITATESAPNTLWGPPPTTAAEDGTQSGPLGGYHADTAVIVSAGARSDNLDAHDAGTGNAPAAGKRVAYRIGQAVDAMGVIAPWSGGDWHTDNMEHDGLLRSEASVQMEGNGWLDPMTITQGTVIMNDNWSVAGALEARNRVRSLVPAGVLDEVGDFLGLMGKVPGMRELKYFGDDAGRGVFGYVDMEHLPLSENVGDRPLKAYEEAVR